MGSLAVPDPADATARLLALVLERAPRTLAGVADELGLVEPEIAPLLAALERHGLVARDDAGRLRPGPAAGRFARSAVARQELAAHAAGALRRLAEETGETANLMVPTPDGTEAIAQEDGRHLLGATNWIGRDIPDHASAAGKLFLAHGVSGIPTRMQRFTEHTLADRARLEADLATVRDRGYATLVDELEPGLSVVAAPVFDAGGAVVAALTVSGPTSRLPAPKLGLVGRVTIEQAHAVSERLGYRGALEDALA
jgi:IclR family transcriptional regulator, acetate operon repressor